jgi:hypothetical protein
LLDCWTAAANQFRIKPRVAALAAERRTVFSAAERVEIHKVRILGFDIPHR